MIVDTEGCFNNSPFFFFLFFFLSVQFFVIDQAETLTKKWKGATPAPFFNWTRVQGMRWTAGHGSGKEKRRVKRRTMYELNAQAMGAIDTIPQQWNDGPCMNWKLDRGVHCFLWSMHRGLCEMRDRVWIESSIMDAIDRCPGSICENDLEPISSLTSHGQMAKSSLPSCLPVCLRYHQIEWLRRSKVSWWIIRVSLFLIQTTDCSSILGPVRTLCRLRRNGYEPLLRMGVLLHIVSLWSGNCRHSKSLKTRIRKKSDTYVGYIDLVYRSIG